MKKLSICLLLNLLSLAALAQVTVDPFFFTIDDEITLTVDLKEANDSRAQDLLGLTSGVYLWAGAGTNEDPFTYEPSAQNSFNQAVTGGEMTLVGDDVWTITLTPKTYFEIPDGETITTLGLLLKNTTGTAQTEDLRLDVIQPGEFKIALKQPKLPLFVDPNENFTIEVVSSLDADISVSLNGIVAGGAQSVRTFTLPLQAPASGEVLVEIAGINDSMTEEIAFTYIVRAVMEESRPPGIKRGINYDETDNTRATVCLQAPGKSSVYVIGDFNDWIPSASSQMKKDGEFFWLELTGLTPGTEYAFQYLVDESIYIAEPYCDKILDGFDSFIPENIYPQLKNYPAAAVNPIGFYNTVSVLETGQSEYQWNIADFQKPPKENLIIYELLVRDFFNNGDESYQNLIDTLSYIQSLGVNAIELMPTTEFFGNDSWGYNPTFMFAPDKAYGKKNDLKAFIDAAHEMGIAVILDMVLNQQEQPSPLILMDFNLGNSQVTPENPYFNVSATHPFNVFYDMNHESSYTQSFVDTVNHYWLNEYKFDGYRFDLSKGFTQTNYGQDVGAWSSYDAGRVATLKRMADAIWTHSPDAYVILEHFADNSEETELANYGMMLWGNMHFAYAANANGVTQDINWIYHETRGWNEPNVVGYMESHDEERILIFENEAWNSNLKSTFGLVDALERIKLAHAFMMMVPGPKMMWQFGELGYDVSINENGRTGQKPNPWNTSENLPLYLNPDRTRLRKVISILNQMKRDYPVFSSGTLEMVNTGGAVKQLKFTDAAGTINPTTAEQMSVVIVGNFSTSPEIANWSLPLDGIWYHVFDQNESVEINGNTITATLQPGELRVYTNFQLDNIDAELLEFVEPLAPTNLTVEETEDGAVLSWQNTSVIANGTKIYRFVGTDQWEEVGEVSQTSSTYTDANVEAGSTYIYRVGAYTEVGETFSNEVEISITDFVPPLAVQAFIERIYPNPTSGTLTIQSKEEMTALRVFQLDGKQVFQIKTTGRNTEVNLQSLRAGIYLLEVSFGGGESYRQKIIKK